MAEYRCYMAGDIQVPKLKPMTFTGMAQRSGYSYDIILSPPTKSN